MNKGLGKRWCATQNSKIDMDTGVITRVYQHDETGGTKECVTGFECLVCGEKHELHSYNDNKDDKPLPFRNIHPGEVLREVMEDFGCKTEREFSFYLLYSCEGADIGEYIASHLKDIIARKSILSEDLLDRFEAEKRLIPYGFRLIQKNYLKTEELKKERERERVKGLLKWIKHNSGRTTITAGKNKQIYKTEEIYTKTAALIVEVEELWPEVKNK